MIAIVRSVAVLMVFLAATAAAQVPPDRDGLLAGDAMGQAAVAEMNGCPNPAKLLEAAKTLKLTPTQTSGVEAIVRDLRTRAVDLGKRIVAVEEELSDAFKSGLVSEKTIQETADQIAKLRGKLRALHLAAAFKARAILTDEQMRAYAALKPAGKAPKK